MIDTMTENQPFGECLTFDEAFIKTEDKIRHQLKNTPAVIRQLTGHLSRAAGKYIRARSVLSCAILTSGLIPEDAVLTAAAVELLHLATLVHDDVIDNAEKRRGITALHKKFGEKSAVLCGDYLFCLALEIASGIKPREDRKELVERNLPSYMTAILAGEMLQNKNNRNYGLSEREYIKIIRGKTAAMFEASFHAGFLHSDDPGGLKDNYLEIGRNIGITFQLSDDCADYESTQKKSKKPVLSDFKNGVVTLPLITALKADKSLLGRIESGIDPLELKKAVYISGGLDYTHQKITELYKKTSAIIAALPVLTDKKDRLTALLDKSAGI